MNDLGTALMRELQGPAADGAAALPRGEGLADDARDVMLAHARRVRRIGLAAVGAVVAAGAAVWIAMPEPIPTTVADAVVREVEAVPWGFQAPYCYDGEGSDLVPQFAPPGVSIADDSVRDSGIEVSATLLRGDVWGDESTELSPGEPIDVRGEPTVLSGDDDTRTREAVAMVFDITWDGDEEWYADAAVMLTSGERLVSPVMSTPVDLRTYDYQPYPIFDSTEGRTRMVISGQVMPGCDVDNTDMTLSVPADAPLELHTVVQIKDRAGVPLATFVDVTGFEDSSVTYSGLLASGNTYQVGPVTSTEREAARLFHETWSRRAAAPSGLVSVLLETDGVPLQQAGLGFRTDAVCRDLRGYGSLRDAAVPVLPANMEVRELPDQLSLAELRSRDGITVTVDSSGGWEAAQYGSLTVLFVDGDRIVAVLMGEQVPTFEEEAERFYITFRDTWADQACLDVDPLDPGQYRMLSVTAGSYWSAQDPAYEEFQGYMSLWTDHGTVTVVP